MEAETSSRLVCISCGAEYPLDYRGYRCARCGDLLDVIPEIPEISGWEMFKEREWGVWRYREFLPLDYSRRVSLREGGTPLIRCRNLSRWTGVRELYVKFEGANPTGSFKDRGMTVAVTKAVKLGAHGVICASTGNTAASLAAYAARAGLRSIVAIPEGAIAMGKLFQAIAHGATIVKVRGNFDNALKLVFEAAERLNLYLLNSVNPWRLEGQKTLAFEVAEELGHDLNIAVPVGNCGNIAAIWKGFKELRESRLTEGLPKMIGVQAEGASPFARLVREGRKNLEPVDKPQTIATAIRIGRPVNWKKALRAVKESNGLVETVLDKEILDAQHALARLEGIGVEPASAAALAGVKKLAENGEIDVDRPVVCVCTGHLLKDPSPALFKPVHEIEVKPEIEELLEKMKKITSPEVNSTSSSLLSSI